MTNNLTKIASLPGSGGGCMSSLPAEKNEAHPLLELGQILALLFGYVPPGATVQMKAEYFQEPDELEFPPIEAPPTIEELAKKYLAAHEGLAE